MQIKFFHEKRLYLHIKKSGESCENHELSRNRDVEETKSDPQKLSRFEVELFFSKMFYSFQMFNV